MTLSKGSYRGPQVEGASFVVRPVRRSVSTLCVLSMLGCASGWPPPPDRSDPGVRAGLFSVPETPPYGLRGRYSGEILTRSDSIWVVFDSAFVALREASDERPVTLEYVGAGLVGSRGFAEDFFIRGSERRVRTTLRLGDERSLGSFYIGVAGDGSRPLDSLHLRIIHRLSLPGVPVAETYTWFSRSVGDILEPTRE